MNKEKMIAKCKSAVVKAVRFVASRAFYLVLGVFLATAAVALAATTWDSTADSSGTLTMANWNGLVNNLKNNSGPKNWTCSYQTIGKAIAANAGDLATANCAAGEVPISGGCILAVNNAGSSITGSMPSFSAGVWRWMCSARAGASGDVIQSHVACCK